MLAVNPFVALDKDQFADLLPGQTFPDANAAFPTLVRAVALDKVEGGFNAEEKGNEVLVIYAGRGVRTTARHQALVLLLSAPATKLYVTTLANNF
jgi:hypothetical protein